MSDFVFLNFITRIDDIIPIISLLISVPFATAFEKMIANKYLLALLTILLLLPATMCLAEEPSFPQAAKGVEELLVENQFIIQFDSADDFEQSKQGILNDDEVQVVRYIDTRNIGVYKFSSKKAAAEWRDDAVGVKYFEAGEKWCWCIYFKNRDERIPP